MRKIRPRAGRAALVAISLLASPVLSQPVAHAATGPPTGDGLGSVTAKITVGDHQRGCTGTLVDSSWLLTAASCFAKEPSESLDVPQGRPEVSVTATIGDTSVASRQDRNVVALVPRKDRDVVLARLSRPVTNVTPASLSVAEPAVGEKLTVAGYGRSRDEWAPFQPHTAALVVDSVDGSDIRATGDDSAVCPGDAGGPAVRTTDDRVEVVAVNSRSQQGSCFGIDEKQTGTGTVSSRVDDLGPWVTEHLTAPPGADFDCDGVEDIAVSDPEASVEGSAQAGLVHVSYGDGRTESIHQNLPGVPGGAEPEDGFGEALAVVDYDEDGCSDLVVGIPREDIGNTADAGMVSILYGSPDGLTKGRTSTNLRQGKGEGAIGAAASEAGDKMGSALAAGETAQGEPYLIIGVPGEALGTVTEAGNAYYLRGETNVAINQNKNGIAGKAEAGDRWGASVAASPHHLTVGIPGEAIGTKTDSGAVQILSHAFNREGIPAPVKGVHQDTSGINGAAEVDDRFGEAVTMVDYRPTSSRSEESILAIGSPGEALGDIKEAGRVVTLRITGPGSVEQLADISQGKSDVTGKPEAGDLFGQQLTAIDLAPHTASSPTNTILAVGTPGEDIKNIVDAGTIQVFPLVGPPGDADVSVEPGKVGLPGTSGADEKLGSSLHATPTHLYIGMPYGPAPHGSLHTLPLSNITAGTSETVDTYEPGKGEIPSTGKRFGAVAR
ncbi:trypsin-like serine protease [Streptomyces cacaoi]